MLTAQQSKVDPSLATQLARLDMLPTDVSIISLHNQGKIDASLWVQTATATYFLSVNKMPHWWTVNDWTNFINQILASPIVLRVGTVRYDAWATIMGWQSVGSPDSLLYYVAGPTVLTPEEAEKMAQIERMWRLALIAGLAGIGFFLLALILRRE